LNESLLDKDLHRFIAPETVVNHRRDLQHVVRTISILLLLTPSIAFSASLSATYRLANSLSEYPDPVTSFRVAFQEGDTNDVQISFHRESGEAFGFRASAKDALGLLRHNPVESLDRYQLMTKDAVLEFRDKRTGKARLSFSFSLQPAAILPDCLDDAGHWRKNCSLLGNEFTLEPSDPSTVAELSSEARVIELDDDLFVGTSRNERDTDHARIPQWRFVGEGKLDYHYADLTHDDLKQMIDAGMNYFDRVEPAQYEFLFDKPVFFDLMSFERETTKLFPVVFFHPGFLGVEDFLDEPAYIYWEDTSELNVANDLAGMAKKQSEATKREFNRSARGRLPGLAQRLKTAGIEIHGIELIEPAFPIWEEFYDTACYQLGVVPVIGFIHEGRYKHPATIQLINKTFRTSLPQTPETLFRFYYSFLRGAARLFNTDWGMSIYGQADPEIVELGMQMAYDRGARFIFFWTSDRDHHVPFEEQLEWARSISRYAKKHPRASRRDLNRAATDAIVLPYGFTFPMSDWDKSEFPDLWHRKQFSIKEGAMPDGTRYYSVLRTAAEKMEELLNERREFDIVIAVPELSTAHYARVYDILPDAKQNNYTFPWWLNYFWPGVVALLASYLTWKRVRWFASWRRGASAIR